MITVNSGLCLGYAGVASLKVVKAELVIFGLRGCVSRGKSSFLRCSKWMGVVGWSSVRKLIYKIKKKKFL